MTETMTQLRTLDPNVPQKVEYCIPLWVRDEQMLSGIRRPFGRIQPNAEPTDEPVAIAAFGPSLRDTWDQLKGFKTIFSCSGSHKFLIERGIIPTYHIEVDPRAHKCLLIGEPHKDVQYLIASCCHPKLFDMLEGFNTKLWHVFANDKERTFPELFPRGEWALTGGCSVGLRCMTIGRFLGYRNQHIFGMDGSFPTGQKHAAAHPNQHKDEFETHVNGKKFLTTPSFLEAGRQTFHELDQMPDVTAKFYGEGLVQEMAKTYVRTEKSKKKAHGILGFTCPETISSNYADLNRKLHRDNLAYGVGGGKHKKVVLDLAEKIGTRSILDYGCQLPDARVLTPTGWCRMDKLRVGDQVIGSDGQPTMVDAVHSPGIVPVYEVNFSDRTSVVVDGNHLWAVRTSNHQKRGEPFQVKRTADLVGDLRWPNAAVDKWRIPMVKPVAFPDTEKRIVLHPYLLGLLIGHGSLTQNCPILHTVRQELVDAATKTIPKMTAFRRRTTKSFVLVTVGGKHGSKNPVTAELRRLGIMGRRAWEKFIPGEYLYAPVEERIALLQGLIDTDGEVREKHLSYSTTSRQLAADVVFLVQSLGGNANLTERKQSRYPYRGEIRLGRRSYVVHLRVPATIRPTRTKTWIPRTEYHPNRIIRSIKPVGEARVIGIAVTAADGLYVTENCVVTHNCGKGYLAKALPWPIWEYDPAISGKDASPRPADLVVCTDVLEHIEPDKLGAVLEDLKRCVRKLGYFVVHTGPSTKTLEDGRNSHLIQKDAKWWLDSLRQFFQIPESGMIIRKPLVHFVAAPKS